MTSRIGRLAIGAVAALAPVAWGVFAASGVSAAAVCGEGTVLDPASNTCVVAEQPPPPLPPPPPPPPAWNGPRPYVSASVCAPIPFVSLCVGI